MSYARKRPVVPWPTALVACLQICRTNGDQRCRWCYIGKRRLESAMKTVKEKYPDVSFNLHCRCLGLARHGDIKPPTRTLCKPPHSILQGSPSCWILSSLPNQYLKEFETLLNLVNNELNRYAEWPGRPSVTHPRFLSPSRMLNIHGIVPQ